MSNKNKYEDFDEEFDFDDEEGTSIDWANIFRKLYAKKKLFIISFFVTVIMGIPILLTIPMYYAAEVKLAPELSTMVNSTSSISGLSSIMKSFGYGSSMMGSSDAILPNLYPDLMNSTSFMVSLFDVPVETRDGEVKTTYYKYIKNYQEVPFWAVPIGWVMSLIPDFTKDIPAPKNTKKHYKGFNAGALTKSQTAVLKTISKKILCSVDEETGVITIDVKDQDPLVCAAIADSTCQRLQEFITEYRTKKSKVELENAQRQYNQAVVAYNVAKQKLEAFNDSNWDLIDEEMLIQKQALLNDMQLKYSNMTTFNTQLMSARSKYESMRPVFTVLNNATVPLKPAGPSRTKILLVLIIFVIGSEVAWVLFKDIAKEKIATLKQAPAGEK